MSLLVLALIFSITSVNSSPFGYENTSSPIKTKDVPKESISRVSRGVYSSRVESRPSTVLIELRSHRKPICTGNLVTLSLVLTAANCAYDGNSKTRFSNSDLYIHAGTDSYEEPYLNGGGSQVSEVLIHPEYECCRRNDHDVALFKIPSPLAYSTKIQAVQLSTAPLQMGMSECDVTGFGNDGSKFTQVISITSYSRTRYPLKMKTLSVTKQCVCTRQRKNKEISIRNPFICQHVTFGKYEIVSEDRGAGLFCEGKVYGIFTSTLSKGYRDECLRNATVFQDRLVDSDASERYTLTFTDLCLNLRWINKHADVFTRGRVTKNCGEKYAKQQRSLRDKARNLYLSGKGSSTALSPSFVLVLLSRLLMVLISIM